jgi:hypothetical protein
MNNKMLFKILFVLALLTATFGLTAVFAQNEQPAENNESAVLLSPDDGSDDTPAGALDITCGQTLSGVLSNGSDVDYYRFNDYYAENYVAYVSAQALGYPTNAKLSFVDTNGSTILRTNNDFDGLDPRVHYTLLKLATHYLKVEPSSAGGANHLYEVTLDKPLYLTMKNDGQIAGISYKAGDILVYYMCADRWEMFFDASDVGVSKNLRGFAILPGLSHGPILMTFGAAANIPGIGAVAGQDIVAFTMNESGEQTSGTFAKFFDGSDVGLTTNGEFLDALAVDENGDVLLSIKGTGSVSGINTIKDEDIIRFHGTSYGENTTGTFSVNFDGSDEALNGVDVWDVWREPYWPELEMTFDQSITLQAGPGDFFVTRPEDIAGCHGASTGPNSDCLFWFTAFDGSAHGLTNPIDGFSRGDHAVPGGFVP